MQYTRIAYLQNGVQRSITVSGVVNAREVEKLQEYLQNDPSGAERLLRDITVPGTQNNLPFQGRTSVQNTLPFQGWQGARTTLPGQGWSGVQNPVPFRGRPGASYAVPTQGQTNAQNTLPSRGWAGAQNALSNQGRNGAQNTWPSRGRMSAQNTLPTQGRTNAQSTFPPQGQTRAQNTWPSRGQKNAQSQDWGHSQSRNRNPAAPPQSRRNQRSSNEKRNEKSVKSRLPQAELDRSINQGLSEDVGSPPSERSKMLIPASVLTRSTASKAPAPRKNPFGAVGDGRPKPRAETSALTPANVVNPTLALRSSERGEGRIEPRAAPSTSTPVSEKPPSSRSGEKRDIRLLIPPLLWDEFDFDAEMEEDIEALQWEETAVEFQRSSTSAEHSFVSLPPPAQEKPQV